LQGIAGRLADAWNQSQLPDQAELVQRLLAAIRQSWLDFTRLHLAGLSRQLESCWGAPREVVLEPARGVERQDQRGWFLGIDAQGAVRLRTATGGEVCVPAHHIQRLREV